MQVRERCRFSPPRHMFIQGYACIWGQRQSESNNCPEKVLEELMQPTGKFELPSRRIHLHQPSLTHPELDRAKKKSLQLLLSSAQAGPDRAGKRKHEEISCNHAHILFPQFCNSGSSVLFASRESREHAEESCQPHLITLIFIVTKKIPHPYAAHLCIRAFVHLCMCHDAVNEV